ncbi:hypothetical protein EDC91_1507 [Shewanella fodinae]|uniref:Uncharacterized protein n=1 Tax=Shewanella fodinae TaxID=552357 RepID=A0A4V2RRJ9_9GAMM|nr:hypothetical protein EDC91_1507 [Shewanella fodinae]
MVAYRIFPAIKILVDIEIFDGCVIVSNGKLLQ